MNDQIEDFFERERAAVPLLAAPSGRYDELASVARRRRARHSLAAFAATAAVVAVVGTGVVLAVLQTPARHRTGTISDPSVLHTVAPTVTATTRPPVDPTVPRGFKAWSVTFVANGRRGYSLGGYPCAGGNQCVAVLETTNSMQSWHTIAEPGTDGVFGLAAGAATLRFANSDNGWIVGGSAVWSTHDGGRTWQPVGVLAGQQIDTLEAASTHVYAVSRSTGSVWVSTDTSTDAGWATQDAAALGGPVGATGEVSDTLSATNEAVVAVRFAGGPVTARLSLDGGTSWTTVPSPCAAAATAPVFTLVDEHSGRFGCADGSIRRVFFDGKQPAHEDAQLSLISAAGRPARARSVSVNSTVGTVFAYSNAGLWSVTSKGSVPLAHGDFGFVGLTTETQGIALPSVPSESYWYSTNGGKKWRKASWR